MPNIPNLLSASRIIITYAHIILMELGAIDPLISAVIPFIGTFTDIIDGRIARKYGMKTKSGDVMDVVGDRVQELSYWIYFAYAGAIPVWIPLIFAGRGVIVDAIVGYSRTKGFTRLSLTGKGWSWWFTSSRYSRAASGTSKVLAFALLAYGSVWGLYLSFVALAINLIKGAPVIYQGSKLFADD